MSIDSASWFYVQKGKSNSLFFLLFKVEQRLQLHQSIRKLFPQIPSLLVYAGIWNGWLPNVPSLMFSFSELQLRVIAKQRNEFLLATYCRFMADIPRQMLLFIDFKQRKNNESDLPF